MNPAQSIFIATASNIAAARNVDATVVNAVESEVLSRWASTLPPGIASEPVHAWGLSRKALGRTYWSDMQVGDLVLFVSHKHYRYVTKVIAKTQNAPLARDLWGEVDGKTWELVFFLQPSISINVPVDALTDYLPSRYMGFIRLAPERVTRIQTDFGSVETFLNEKVLDPNASRDRITRADVLDAFDAYEAGMAEKFGVSTSFNLLYGGLKYPPKAIFALASRRTAGRLLSPEEVDTGDNSLCFRTLRSLGFEISRLG